MSLSSSWLACLGLILWTVISKGLPALNWDMVTKTPKGGFYMGKEGGVLNAIIGSAYLASGGTLLALLFSLPIALYLQTYLENSDWGRYVRLSLDVLWGIPSIVYGAFGFILMLALGMRASLLAGIVVLALIELPIMVRAMDEVIRRMPADLEHAALALGSTKLEVALERCQPPDAAGNYYRRPAGLRARDRGRRLRAVHCRIHRPYPHLADAADRLPPPGCVLPTEHTLPGSAAARLCFGRHPDDYRSVRQPGFALDFGAIE